MTESSSIKLQKIIGKGSQRAPVVTLAGGLRFLKVCNVFNGATRSAPWPANSAAALNAALTASGDALSSAFAKRTPRRGTARGWEKPGGVRGNVAGRDLALQQARKHSVPSIQCVLTNCMVAPRSRATRGRYVSSMAGTFFVLHRTRTSAEELGNRLIGGGIPKNTATPPPSIGRSPADVTISAGLANEGTSELWPAKSMISQPIDRQCPAAPTTSASAR